MSDKCGYCGREGDGPVGNDAMGYYTRKCLHCGASTYYNRKGDVQEVYKPKRTDTPAEDARRMSSEELGELKAKGERWSNAWWADRMVEKLRRGW